MEIFGVFSAFGLSASAGLNAYIPLLVVAFLAKFTDLIRLNSPWDTLTSWWIIALLVVLSLIEIFADKVPAVNHLNDVIQSFVRPAAGAVVFAASAHAVSDIHPILAMGSGLLVAGGVHAVKALAMRPMVTATTGGAGNVPVSILEDVVSTAVSLLSVIVPLVVGCLMILVILWIIFFMLRRSRRSASTG